MFEISLNKQNIRNLGKCKFFLINPLVIIFFIFVKTSNAGNLSLETWICIVFTIRSNWHSSWIFSFKSLKRTQKIRDWSYLMSIRTGSWLIRKRHVVRVCVYHDNLHHSYFILKCRSISKIFLKRYLTADWSFLFFFVSAKYANAKLREEARFPSEGLFRLLSKISFQLKWL